MLYPAGWGARRVKSLCGDHSQAFLMDECAFGELLIQEVLHGDYSCEEKDTL